MRAWRAAAARSAARDLDRVDEHGESDGPAALEPGERAHDRLLGRLAVDPEPRLAGHDLDREAAADELRLDMARSTSLAMPASL